MKGRYNTTTEKVTNTETLKDDTILQQKKVTNNKKLKRRYNTTTEKVTNAKTIDQ